MKPKCVDKTKFSHFSSVIPPFVHSFLSIQSLWPSFAHAFIHTRNRSCVHSCIHPPLPVVFHLHSSMYSLIPWFILHSCVLPLIHSLPFFRVSFPESFIDKLFLLSIQTFRHPPLHLFTPSFNHPLVLPFTGSLFHLFTFPF